MPDVPDAADGARSWQRGDGSATTSVCLPSAQPQQLHSQAHEHHIWGYFLTSPQAVESRVSLKPIHQPPKPQAPMITHLLRGDSEAPLVPVTDLS